MKDKFLIIDKLKRTIIYIDKILDNFPRRSIELRLNINNSLYDMLDLLYLANNNIEKSKNSVKAIVKLQLVDFYLMITYKKDVISKKKYESISKHLLELKKMITVWSKNEES